MAETADFELVQAVRGMAGRISDPGARMTSKMDRSKQRIGLGNPMVKSRGVCTATLKTEAKRSFLRLQYMHPVRFACRCNFTPRDAFVMGSFALILIISTQ